MEKDLKLTAEEAQVLINLLDIAQKAAGLQASEACVHFGKKITTLINEFKASEPKSEPKSEEKDKHSTAIEDAVEVK